MSAASAAPSPMTSGNNSRTFDIDPELGSDSMRSAGVVSRPCHDVASLKYSFWAPLRYGPWPAGYSVGGIQHVIQTKQDNPPTGSESGTIGNGGGTLKIAADAISLGRRVDAGSDGDHPRLPP